MKKASKILFLVTGILGIVSAVGLFVCGALGYAVGGLAIAYYENPHLLDSMPEIKQAIDNALTQYHVTLVGLASACMTYATLCVVFGVLCIPTAVLSFICRKKEHPNNALVVVTLVFSVLSTVWTGVVGAIFAIVDNSRAESSAE